MISKGFRVFLTGLIAMLCAFLVGPACKCNRSSGGVAALAGIDVKNVVGILLEASKSKGIVSVTCPPVVDSAVGTVFVCTGQHKDGKTYNFEVKVVGDQGQIEFKDVSGF
jgi:hypothetical protein